jgi:aldehyde dehydrogenase (NAD+)
MDDLTRAAEPAIAAGDRQLLIDGQWVDPVDGGSLSALDPATGEEMARIADAGPRDVDRAVLAARRAFDGPWRRATPFDRQAILLRLADLVDAHFERLIAIDARDVGTPIGRLRGARALMVGRLRYYASLATDIHGDTIETSVPGEMFAYTLREPVGVVGGIIPWNGPLTSMIWRVGPVLATGCTAVIKPAEDASLSSLYFGQLLLEAGVPPGVVNIVTGRGATAGAALADHMGVDKIAFTGSTATGQRILAAAARNMKRVTLELGGKSANIVFPDADLDEAVPACAWAGFGNTGQLCAAGSRLFVHRAIHGEFVERLAAFTATLRIGAGSDPDTQIGPLISARQHDRVSGYCDQAVRDGLRLAAGGGRPSGEAFVSGHFFAPTIFDDVGDDSILAREEIFGPVLSVIPFDGVDEVIRRANDSPYGLAGGLWTSDANIIQAVTRGVRTGTIWVNSYSLFDPAVPFGGFKMSGIGRESGRQHIDEFLETKSVWLRTRPPV